MCWVSHCIDCQTNKKANKELRKKNNSKRREKNKYADYKMTINLETFDTPNALMPVFFLLYITIMYVYSIFIRRPLSHNYFARFFFSTSSFVAPILTITLHTIGISFSISHTLDPSAHVQIYFGFFYLNKKNTYIMWMCLFVLFLLLFLLLLLHLLHFFKVVI